VGDGILEAYDAIGLGDVGPRVIMAHEFGHHVQFELGVFDGGPADPAEATRRTELMADAMASYFGTHKQGLALNRKRVADALLSFYTVGDCYFDDPGHHGTPLQRQRAADWGADLAAAANPRSYIIPPARFVQLFEAALPHIVSGS
jgi:predicted metalloprotease